MKQMEKWITQKWEKEHRLYRCVVKQDMFNNWLVQRQWGSKNSNRWQGKTVICDSYEQALGLLQETAERREKRNYKRM